jgi:hypothetical protein
MLKNVYFCFKRQQAEEVIKKLAGTGGSLFLPPALRILPIFEQWFCYPVPGFKHRPVSLRKCAYGSAFVEGAKLTYYFN